MKQDDTKKGQDSKIPEDLLKENNPAIAKIIEDMQRGTATEQDQDKSKQHLPEQEEKKENSR